MTKPTFLRLMTAMLLSLPAPTWGQAAVTQDLTGTWDGVIRLDSVWRLRERPSSRSIPARIRFNAVGDASPATVSARTVHPGNFEIDFARFGFSLSSRDALGWLVAPNSIRAVLNPGVDHGSVELSGAVRGDSIVGTWRYVSDPGGATGTFALRRVAGRSDAPADAITMRSEATCRRRASVPSHLVMQEPALAHYDLRDGVDVRHRRPEVHDARAEGEPIIDHGVREVDRAAVLQARE